MNSLDKDFAAGALDPRDPPCISLYQPTHPRHPDNQQDPIRFRNLVKRLRERLLLRSPAQEVDLLLQPFQRLTDDHTFWTHSMRGLAVFAARDMFKVYRVPRRMPELVVVADSFHTKPLLRLLQSTGRFQVLGLSRQEIHLFEGTQDDLREITPAAGVPRTLVEALGAELTEPHSTVASYGGGGTANSTMHHGHGGRSAEVDIDTERFFRAVDRAIMEHHSRPSGMPLLLATLPEHRALFHQVSHNPFLLREGIDLHPSSLSLDELRERAWRVVEPYHKARINTLADEFGTARAKGLGQNELSKVATAVVRAAWPRCSSTPNGTCRAV
ncbi:MAG: hypothetical protein ABIZ91_00195 [Gemmatimonadaceae bacterium]